MRKIFRYISLCWILLSCTLVMAQNGVAPEITAQPQDMEISCDAPNVQESFEAWYTSHGGMMTEGEGSLTIQGSLSQEDAWTSYLASVSCGSTHFVTLQFIVTDEDGDTAISEEVTFRTVDTQNPVINVDPQPVTLSCTGVARDSFVNWIQAHGNAAATDNCGGIIWSKFIWNDSEGNSGTSNISNGPYPIFPEVCNLSYNIVFIASDSCGNETGKLTKFTLVDDVPPVFNQMLSDTIVSCITDTAPSISIEDYCDPNATLVYSEISTQDPDTTSCEHYDYVLTRKWVASDACGNVDSIVQQIAVMDTLSPLVVSDSIVAVACMEDIDFKKLISVDDCSSYDHQISIDTLENMACLQRYALSHTLTDVCGNVASVDQVLEVKDTLAPTLDVVIEDRQINCDTLSDLATAIEAFISEIEAREIRDACNEASFFVALPNSYKLDDPTTYPGRRPAVDTAKYCSTDRLGRVYEDSYHIVRYDDCGNIGVDTITFSIIDNTPPTIASCIEDFDIITDVDQCEGTIHIPVLEVSEGCALLGSLPSQALRYYISVDGLNEREIKGDGTDSLTSVPQGNHVLRYTVIDCSGNKASCDFNVLITDGSAPSIACPTDRMIESDSCTAQVDLSQGIEIDENCAYSKVYRQKLPVNGQDALLRYEFVNNDTLIANKRFVFKDVFPLQYSQLEPMVTFEYRAATGVAFKVFSEDNELIHSFSGVVCKSRASSISLDIEDFNSWASDGFVDFTIIMEGGQDISCGTIEEGIDQISQISAELSYSEAEIYIEVDGATTLDRQLLSPNALAILNTGVNNIHYFIEDAASNQDSCQTTLTISERTSPEAVCQNIVVEVLPSTEVAITLDPLRLDDGSEDNCGIARRWIRDSIITCSLVDQEIERWLIVEDYSGNRDSCVSKIKVNNEAFEPTYNSGVCVGDSLQLFANPPGEDGEAYTYRWTGPNFSSTEANPVITNASQANNGLYEVTIRGFGDCEASATVQVNTSILSTPDISLTGISDTICAGEEILLQADTYTGNISYQWFEGSFPNGLLLGTSVQPSFGVNLTTGVHEFYVIVSGENCSSNPSRTLRVTAVEKPEVTTNDPFVSVCEGEKIILGTSVFGSQYKYRWVGPNEYSSNRPIPPVIDDASLINQGDYTLTISIGGCASDPALSKVSVFSKPIRPIIAGNTVFCEGAPFNLTVNNIPQADKYLWYLDGVLYTFTSGNNLILDNTLPTFQGDWQVQVDKDQCLSDTSAIRTIKVNDLANISATFTGNPCEGDTIQLLATYVQDASYTWTGPNGFSSSVQNPRIIAIPGEYTVTVMTSEECSTTTSTNISVYDAPVITALTSDAPECVSSDDVITFYPTIVPFEGDYTFQWSGPQGYTSTDANAVLTDIDASDIGLYTLIVNDTRCNSLPFDIALDFTLTPLPPTIEVVGNACTGKSFELHTVSSGSSYLWKTPNGDQETNEPSLIFEQASNNADGKYTLQIKEQNCTSEASESVQIDIVDPPNDITPQSNSPICKDSDLKLWKIEPYQFRWIDDNQVFDKDTFILEDVTTMSLADFRYVVQQSYCTSDTLLLKNITILDELSKPRLNEINSFLCLDGDKDSIQLCIEAGYIDGARYVLSNALTQQEILATKDSCFYINQDMVKLGTSIFTVSANLNSCKSPASELHSIKVSNRPTIVAGALENPVYVCADEAVVQSQETTESIQVTWRANVDDDLIIMNTNSGRTTVSDLQQGENTVLLTWSQGGCLDFSQDTVRIFKEFAPMTEPDQDTTLVSESLSIDVLNNDDIPQKVLIAIVRNASHGTARVVDGTVIYTPEDGYAGEDRFTYQVCSELCDQCEENTVTVYVDDSNVCYGPNLISPNGDGINDYLFFPCLVDQAIEGSLVVYNEWGHEVYSSEQYENDWPSLDEAENLPIGTYFYVFSEKDGTRIFKNYVNIQK